MVIEKVAACLVRQKILNADRTPGPNFSTVTVGFSGGADSVCLLSCLVSLGCRVHAVHINHMIRGSEAEQDAEFARSFCAQRGIPFTLIKADVPAYAQECGLTCEQAARELRYRELRLQAGGGLIAVAHNKNDQAETVLLRLVRGSGITGLCAMSELSGDILRPLLDVSRAEIERYCAEHDLKYVTDSTNLIPDCSRNIIRLEVLPRLAGINPAAVDGIVRGAQLMASDEECLSMEAHKAAKRILQQEGGAVSVSVPGLLELHRAVAARVLRIAVAEADSPVDIELTHIEACLRLCRSQSGRSVSLPRGITVLRSGDNLIIQKNVQEVRDAEIPFAQGRFELGDVIVAVSLVSAMGERGERCEYISPGDIDGLVLRHRRAGDYIHPVGAPGSKSLKKYLIDKKVPLHRRDNLILAARGSEILAVVGLTVSQDAAVTADSGEIYKIQLE